MFKKIPIIPHTVITLLVIIFIQNISSNCSYLVDVALGSSNKKSVKELDLVAASQTFTKIAKRVIPTVVSIHSTMILKTRDIWNESDEEDEIQNFLGERFYNFPIPKEFRQRGAGSGIIISREGHILTNVHVIENAEYIEVTLYDKRTFEAGVIGVDPLTEVAVIKIDCDDLPVAKLGNSESCEIGEWVLAVGNPLELNSTITAGIISAMGRDINIIRDTYGVENFIQTDAAINPGNSGGALVNLQGEVIGINTAIATENGFNQGYGFAIPINLARGIMHDLIYKGRVVRAYLGISMQDIDEKKARALKLKRPTGVFVDAISEDSPAMKAGLREKDVLVQIGSETVNSANIVQSIIAQKNPGDELELLIIRKNYEKKLKAILGERQQPIMVFPTKNRSNNFKNLGLDVVPLKEKFADDPGFQGEYGVVVTTVERFSPAYEAGIFVNDVILEIEDRVILSVASFKKIIATSKQGDVLIFKLKRVNTIFHAFVEVIL